MDKMYLILNSVKHFSVYSAAEISYKASILGHTFVLSVKFPRGNYLNNRVFLLRNYRLIVAPQKFDVLKTNICPRSEASRANIPLKNIKFPTGNYQTDSSKT